jgi:hypothetical protein
VLLASPSSTPFSTANDRHHWAVLRHGRVKSSPEEIVAALEGHYRAEHLFTLHQSLKSYRHYQAQIADCDRQLRRMLDQFDPNPRNV